MLASLAVHLPVYEVLGALADRFAEKKVTISTPPSSVEFDVDWETSQASQTIEKDAEPERRPKRRAKPKPKKLQAQAQQVVEEVEPAQPIPEPEHQQAIKQKSTDNKVPPPDNAQYIAEENSRVEEETVARLRNYVRDQKDLTAGASSKSATQSPEEGNAREQEIADLREREGSKVRTATVEETLRDRPKEAPTVDPLQGDRVVQSGAQKSSNPPDSLAAAAKNQPQVTITDSAGTFTLSRPAAKPGKGGRAGQGKRGPNLKLSYSQFQAAMGDSQLRRSRNARIQERKSKQRGAGRARQWKEFRAAIENFTPAVKPGNQTALNAAASPFANYIASVHRRIHRQFADEFLAGLPTLSTSPYADTTLRTKLEIVLNRDGSVHRIGVVQTSGLLPFDFSAFNSVIRGQPYAEPPRSILSGDGRVYFHWGFYRNHRQC